MSRKLDAAIAEALGYEVEWKDFPPLQPSETVDGETITAIPVLKGSWMFVPRYSDSGNAMLELEVEMRKRGWQLSIIKVKMAMFATVLDRYDNGYKFYEAEADTMPKAVALAAYKALTGKEWQE